MLYLKVLLAALGLLVLFTAPVPFSWLGLALVGVGIYSALDFQKPGPRFGWTALVVALAACLHYQMGAAVAWVLAPQVLGALVALAALVVFLFALEHVAAAVSVVVLVIAFLVTVDAIADYNGGFPDLSRSTPRDIAFPPQNRTPRPALRILPENPAEITRLAPNAKPPGFDEETRLQRRVYGPSRARRPAPAASAPPRRTARPALPAAPPPSSTEQTLRRLREMNAARLSGRAR